MPSKTTRKTADWVALSVRQPYAQLIVEGIKRFEARTWARSPSGAIAIHASANFATSWKTDPTVLRALRQIGITVDEAMLLPRSAIIGAVDVGGIIEPYEHGHARIAKAQRHLCSSDGYTDNLFLWRLENPTTMAPVSCDGKLGLWPVSRPAALKLERARR